MSGPEVREPHGPELQEPSEAEAQEPRVSGLKAWDAGRLPAVPRWVGVTALVAALLAVAGWVISQQFTSSSASHPRRSATATLRFTSFRDPSGLFHGGYPSTWKTVQSGNAQIVLLAEGPNGASYLVRKSTLPAPAGL